jgi:flagella basal body P-ring formation protein FlgA
MISKADREFRAVLEARLNEMLDAAEVPGSPAARRLQAAQAVGQQMVRDGLWAVERDDDGRVSLRTVGDPDAVRNRYFELLREAGLLRDDA